LILSSISHKPHVINITCIVSVEILLNLCQIIIEIEPIMHNGMVL